MYGLNIIFDIQLMVRLRKCRDEVYVYYNQIYKKVII